MVAQHGSISPENLVIEGVKELEHISIFQRMLAEELNANSAPSLGLTQTFDAVAKKPEHISYKVSDEKQAYRALAAYLLQNIEINGDDLVYTKPLLDAEKQEFYKNIIDTLILADNAEKLAELLTHRKFCQDFMQHVTPHGNFYIVHGFQKSFEMLQKANEMDKADMFINRFFHNITPNINPVLTRQYVFDLVDIGSSRHRFYDAYMVVINKERNERLRKLEESEKQSSKNNPAASNSESTIPNYEDPSP